MSTPETRYAKSGDVNVAYQVLGDGPLDLVMAWGWIQHLDFQWMNPTIASFLYRLASFSRLVLFDKRGSGLSDPIEGAPMFEERMDDIRAVMDAVGSERAALLGFSEGAALAALFAASHPERTAALILYDGVVVGPTVEGISAEEFWGDLPQRTLASLEDWGAGHTMDWVAPSLSEQGVPKEVWGLFERSSMSPGAAAAHWRALLQLDVRDVLPAIRVPTLVMNHAESAIPPAQGKLAAELIPGARYVEVPGRDHLPGAGDPEAVAGEIEEFLTRTRPGAPPDRVLATILFTHLLDSTRRVSELGDQAWRQLRERHDAIARDAFRRFRGNEVKHTGDGFVASFDGPARAIRCACSIRETAREHGIEIRAGVHTGEGDLVGDDLSGLAVHIAARVGGLAGAGEVLVSGTVKDLIIGSGIDLVERGTHELKGVPGSWQLFAVGADDRAAVAG